MIRIGFPMTLKGLSMTLKGFHSFHLKSFAKYALSSWKIKIKKTIRHSPCTLWWWSTSLVFCAVPCHTLCYHLFELIFFWFVPLRIKIMITLHWSIFNDIPTWMSCLLYCSQTNASLRIEHELVPVTVGVSARTEYNEIPLLKYCAQQTAD